MAAGLVGMLAAGFWYVWNEGTGTGSNSLQQSQPGAYTGTATKRRRAICMIQTGLLLIIHRNCACKYVAISR